MQVFYKIFIIAIAIVQWVLIILNNNEIISLEFSDFTITSGLITGGIIYMLIDDWKKSKRR